MERAPDTIRRLPTALTTPPPRPQPMPAQDIVVWSFSRSAATLLQLFFAGFMPVREARIPRRT